MTEINYLEILKLCFLGGKGGCSGCPFENKGFPKCLNIVYKGIEDTINRQKAEIERLNEFKKTVLEMKRCIGVKKEVEAQAVKEFAERLILVEETTAINCATNEKVVRVTDINNLVKEMG